MQRAHRRHGRGATPRRIAAAVLALGAGAAMPLGAVSAAGTTERVSVGPGGVQADRASNISAISGDGRFVAFSSGATNLVPGDTNGTYDVFLRAR